MNKWWGYLHTNNSLQVKRFFDLEDLSEAKVSPFAQIAFGPWPCENREDALDKLQEEIDCWKKLKLK